MIIGWPHSQVSTTHAGFAAQLLDDCADELLDLSRTWDAVSRRWDATGSYGPGEPVPAVMVRSGNRRELIAAAAYAQWIADAIRWEASPRRRSDLVLATPNPDMPAGARLALANIDPAVSQLHQIVDDAVAPGPVPARLGELVDADTLDGHSRARFGVVRGWLIEAAAAVAVSTAAQMTALADHIRTLLLWLDPYCVPG